MDGLAARTQAAGDRQLAPLHPQAPGEKFDQAFVGFPVHWRRSQAQLDAIAMQAGDFRALGPRLGVDADACAVAAELIPAQDSAATERARYSRGISSNCAA